MTSDDANIHGRDPMDAVGVSGGLCSPAATKKGPPDGGPFPRLIPSV
jgi:hypothetical protein